MAKPTEMVRVLKFEDAGFSGDAADANEGLPSRINTVEDALVAAGIFGAESGKDGTDAIVALYREGDKWYFEDTENAGGSRVSLTDLASGSGGLNATTHRALDQLVHDIAETSYLEVTRDGSGKVTDIIVWTTSGKTEKIREANITRASGQVSVIVVKQYDAGVLAETLTGTVTRSSGKVASIDWVLS